MPVAPEGGRRHRRLMHGTNEGVAASVSERSVRLTGPESPHAA
jgi:hypothetical protein